jgi:hypothetical protein
MKEKILSPEERMVMMTPPGRVITDINKIARPKDHAAAAKIFARLLAVVMEAAKEGAEPISIDLATEQLALVTVSANLMLVARIKQTVH